MTNASTTPNNSPIASTTVSCPSFASADSAAVAAAGDDSPPPELFLVVGADLVSDLESWRRPGDLKRLVTLAVVPRPHSPAPAVPDGWRVVRVDGPAVDVSSSEVRRRLAAGGSVEGVVPAGVIRCIRRRDMYAGPR